VVLVTSYFRHLARYRKFGPVHPVAESRLNRDSMEGYGEGYGEAGYGQYPPDMGGFPGMDPRRVNPHKHTLGRCRLVPSP
jgi:hypothetical protein